jgi:hypothetical protein
MNGRKLLAALLASGIMSTGTVLAAPIGDVVDISGDYQVSGRVIRDNIVSPEGQKNSSFFQHTLRINLNVKVDDNTSIFARFSDGKQLGHYDTVYSDGNNSLDWYGVKGNFGQVGYSFGRQALNLGQGNIIWTGYLGHGSTNMFDGAVLTGKVGNADVQVIGGKTTGTLDWDNRSKEWYGFDVVQQLNPNVKAGLAFADNGTDHVRYYAGNATVTFSPKFNINGEYVKSSASNLNKGYFINGVYIFDENNNFTVQYNQVDQNAVDSYNSGIGSMVYPYMGLGLGSAESYSGLTYTYNKTLRKNLTFQAVYEDLKGKGYNGHDREFVSSVTLAF